MLTRTCSLLVFLASTFFLTAPRANAVASAPSSAASTAAVFADKSLASDDYQTVVLDLHKIDLKLYWMKDAKTSFSTLFAVREFLGQPFVMATNSGIYDKQFRPLGLHVERGHELRPLNQAKGSGGNFSMKPNGVFYLDSSGAHVVETSEYPAKKGAAPGGILEATQSGPLLLRDGKMNPQFTEGSANKKLRSGVGVDDDGKVVFAISKGIVSFADFAQFFKKTMHCQNALYLDGTISVLETSERKRAEPATDQLVPFVGIWGASLKTQK